MSKNKPLSEEKANATNQLLDLKQVGNDIRSKIQNERNNILANPEAVFCLIYAVVSTYKQVYPGAKGFVEGRIKSPNSIETKISNEITEILNQIKETPQINQNEVIEKILSIDFKDILAFSVITAVPPTKFKTGSDPVNEKLNGMSERLQDTAKRIEEHNDFINKHKDIEKACKDKLLELKKILENATAENQDTHDIEKIQKDMEKIREMIQAIRENIEYGQKNIDRTQEVYDSVLREMQYQMSLYYVSNLEKFSTFKYWGTESIRKPKEIEKPGFKAVTTGYYGPWFNFEAQGRGLMDYLNGLISKKIENLDFTIIGRSLTEKIENKVRRQYSEVDSINDLEEYIAINSNIVEAKKIYEELKEYEQKLKKSMTDKKEIKRKMKHAFAKAKEILIKKEIENIIDSCIDEMADKETLLEKIKNDENINSIFKEEKKKIKNKFSELSEKEINHKARIRVLYRMKEDEIKKLAKEAVPSFFRCDITNDTKEEPVVYLFSTGESIYRYYYNKLNGLKDENGVYMYQPQEQQKIALLKLTRII